MKSKIIVFTSGNPYCSACVEISKLIEKLREDCRDHVKVIEFTGEEAMSKLEEYGLSFLPSLIINDDVIIEGVCPSLETLKKALKEVKR